MGGDRFPHHLCRGPVCNQINWERSHLERLRSRLSKRAVSSRIWTGLTIVGPHAVPPWKRSSMRRLHTSQLTC